MRLTDDRYTEQRFRLEVALRMIRHEARTSTIRECTGISEDRIRKLHHSYFGDSGATPTHRRRGKSPQQMHCLTHNLQVRTDAALLSGLLVATGVLDAIRRSPRAKIDTESAAQVCDAYELFEQLRPSVHTKEFSFEHAWFLLRLLVSESDLELTQCPRCAGIMLHDRLALRRSMCPLCEIKRLADPKKRPRQRRRRNRDNATQPYGYESTNAGNFSDLSVPLEQS